MPDPLLYHVPTVCTNPVGRDATIMKLWQNTLQGHRAQAITGVDGVGKSTIAVEFCDCARRSKRFTCIHWFPSEGVDAASLKALLGNFMSAMRGRAEKDVLLVFDGVADPDAVSEMLPKHPNMHALMTTPKHDLASTKSLHVVPLEPLSEDAVRHLYPSDGADEARVALYRSLGFVPLLITMCRSLLVTGAASVEQLSVAVEKLQSQRPDGHFSVSEHLATLLTFALGHVRSELGDDGLAMLRCLICFHMESLTPTVMDSVIAAYRREGSGDDAERVISLFRDLNLLTEKWEGEGTTCHTSVVSCLRSSCEGEHLETAAKVLLGMFPRRWRGMGGDVAMDLVRHTRSVVEMFVMHKKPFTAPLLGCCDRAASICAYHEGRELHTAVELWRHMLQQWRAQSNGVLTADIFRISSEAGKVMHHIRHPEAHAMLQDAHAAACELYGALSSEAAVTLGTLSLYLDDTLDTCKLLRTAESTIQAKLSSTDDVIIADEAKMLREVIAVLLTRRVQIAEALGNHTDPSTEGVWDALQRHRLEMQRAQQASKQQRGKR